MDGFMKLMFTLILSASVSVVCAQKVGIGITTPQEKLHVDSSIKIGLLPWTSSSHNRFLKFGDGNNVTIGEVGMDDRLEFSAREFLFKSNGAFPNTGKVGINISTSPSAFLEVNGDLKITDGTQDDGRVLTSDDNGKATWKDLPSKGSGFHANLSNANVVVVPSTDQTITFNNRTILDEGFGYDVSSGLFTASANGLYSFNVKIQWSLATNTQAQLSVSIQRNGATVEEAVESVVGNAGNAQKTISFSTVLKLNALDVVRVVVRQESGDNQEVATSNSSFSGYRLH
jgi:hypothetical protein